MPTPAELNLIPEERADRGREQARLRKQKQRANVRTASVLPSHDHATTVTAEPSLADVIDPETWKAQKILEQLWKLYMAGCTDEQSLAQMRPTTKAEIEAALQHEGRTLDVLKRDAKAAGKGRRFLALQRRAETGDVRAIEVLDELTKSTRITLSAQDRADIAIMRALRQMSIEELKEERDRLRAVLDRPRTFDFKTIPPTVHVVEEGDAETPPNSAFPAMETHAAEQGETSVPPKNARSPTTPMAQAQPEYRGVVSRPLLPDIEL